MTESILDPLDLGKMIRFHRKKGGLTQHELAQMAGLGKTVIFDIEKGKHTVQFDTILKVLSILNIKLNFQSPLMDAYLKDLNAKS